MTARQDRAGELPSSGLACKRFGCAAFPWTMLRAALEPARLAAKNMHVGGRRAWITLAKRIDSRDLLARLADPTARI